MTIHTILFNIFASIAILSATLVIISKNPIHSVIFLILVFCNATGLLLLLRAELLAMMFIIIYVGAIAVLFLFVVMMLNIKVNPQGERGKIFKTLEISRAVKNNGLTSLTPTTEKGIRYVPKAQIFPLDEQNREHTPLRDKTRNIIRHIPIGGVISLIFLTELSLILNNRFSAPMQSLGEQKIQKIQEKLAQVTAPGNTQTLNLEYGVNQWEDLVCYTNLIDSVTNIQALGYLIYTHYFYYFIMASLILLIAMIGAIVLTMHKRKNASKRQIIFKQVARSFEDTIGYAKL